MHPSPASPQSFGAGDSKSGLFGTPCSAEEVELMPGTQPVHAWTHRMTCARGVALSPQCQAARVSDSSVAVEKNSAILEAWIAEFVSQGPAAVPSSVCRVFRAGALRAKKAGKLVA